MVLVREEKTTENNALTTIIILVNTQKEATKKGTKGTTEAMIETTEKDMTIDIMKETRHTVMKEMTIDNMTIEIMTEIIVTIEALKSSP